jgi:hypothetical protein
MHDGLTTDATGARIIAEPRLTPCRRTWPYVIINEAARAGNARSPSVEATAAEALAGRDGKLHVLETQGLCLLAHVCKTRNCRRPAPPDGIALKVWDNFLKGIDRCRFERDNLLSRYCM